MITIPIQTLSFLKLKYYTHVAYLQMISHLWLRTTKIYHISIHLNAKTETAIIPAK